MFRNLSCSLLLFRFMMLFVFWLDLLTAPSHCLFSDIWPPNGPFTPFVFWLGLLMAPPHHHRCHSWRQESPRVRRQSLCFLCRHCGGGFNVSVYQQADKLLTSGISALLLFTFQRCQREEPLKGCNIEASRGSQQKAAIHRRSVSVSWLWLNPTLVFLRSSVGCWDRWLVDRCPAPVHC